MGKEISKQDVIRIANLARLELSDSELALYQEKLARVLEYFQELESLDKPSNQAEIQASRHVPSDAKPFRDDEAIVFPAREALVRNAPKMEEQSFQLPKIMEE